MKENKGITLIALIVTIIVLLILAAVSIATLMGKNGVITNAQKTSTENSYYGAIEQVKLAYMAVRTEIMSQVVADGTYVPHDHATDLATVVSNDLSDTDLWTVEGSNSTGIISIKYSDSKIDKDAIKDGTPKYESYINFTITLGDASENTSADAAVLRLDVDDSAVTFTPAQTP